MELHTLDRELFVTQCHNEPIWRFRRDLKFVRERFTIDDKRMVTPGIKILRHIGKQRLAVVADRDGLSVDRFGASDDLSAKELPDRLMPKTDAQDRNLSGKMSDRVHRDARILGRSGPGRNEKPRGFQIAFDLFDSHLIIANDMHFRSQLAKILDEVVCERIVIVDDDKHCSLLREYQVSAWLSRPVADIFPCSQDVFRISLTTAPSLDSNGPAYEK